MPKCHHIKSSKPNAFCASCTDLLRKSGLWSLKVDSPLADLDKRDSDLDLVILGASLVFISSDMK